MSFPLGGYEVARRRALGYAATAVSTGVVGAFARPGRRSHDQSRTEAPVRRAAPIPMPAFGARILTPLRVP